MDSAYLRYTEGELTKTELLFANVFYFWAYQNPEQANKLKHKQFRTKSDTMKDRMYGLCYVATEAAYHYLGGKEAGYTAHYMVHEGVGHWFLKRGDTLIDLTAGQFDTLPDYSLAKRKGFLTKDMSSRAALLLGYMHCVMY